MVHTTVPHSVSAVNPQEGELTMGRAEVYGDNALWERLVYQRLYEQRAIHACVRPGDRSDRGRTPQQWLPLDTPIPVRFLARPGIQEAGIAPIFAADDGTTVIVRRRIVKPIHELTGADLRGCPPDAATAELVRYHLGLHRNCALPGLDETVTVYHFEYAAAT